MKTKEVAITQDTKELFFKSFKKLKNGCWEWSRGKFSTGYGYIYQDKQQLYAHRVSFKLRWPRTSIRGWMILHSCNNRACVNPKHLRKGTNQENMDDRYKAGWWTHQEGGKLRWSKVKLEDRKAIRKKWEEGATLWFLSREYGVGSKTIKRVLDGDW